MWSGNGNCNTDCIYSEVTYRLIWSIVQHTFITVPRPLSIHDTDPASDLGVIAKADYKNYQFWQFLFFFNRTPNWTHILMMTVNQTTEQQQVTSARQALLIHQEWQLMAWWLLKCSKRHWSERRGGQLTNYRSSTMEQFSYDLEMITSEHQQKEALYNGSTPGLANRDRVFCCVSEHA